MNRLKSITLFRFLLRIYAKLARKRIIILEPLIGGIAKLNLIFFSKKADNKTKIGEKWKALMPEDAPNLFVIKKDSERFAVTEIHLKCPLQNTGDIEACHRLMHYDRTLMKKYNVKLEVVNSQASVEHSFCTLKLTQQ